MKRARSIAMSVLGVLGASAIVIACVGDDPSVVGPPGTTDDASTDAPRVDAAVAADTSTPNGDDGAVDAGPRCDVSKLFEKVELLKGISGGDDETSVWVSGDELTAYVAVTPAGGSGSVIKKSTRASRTADFTPSADDPDLAAINSGFAATVPSITSDGLVFFAARQNNTAADGMYVSIRASKAVPFPTPGRAQSRDNDLSFGDPFIAPGGESLFMARDNGTSFDLDEAPRDIGMTYGDGGFTDYAVAPNVVNVNDDIAADRRPVVSANRLTLVFASNRAPGSGTNSDLYIAQRAGTGGTFTSPLRIPEPVSSNAADVPGSLSDDGCALYFTSSRAGGFGGFDVYMALRGK
jgi:hypothetical protein